MIRGLSLAFTTRWICADIVITCYLVTHTVITLPVLDLCVRFVAWASSKKAIVWGVNILKCNDTDVYLQVLIGVAPTRISPGSPRIRCTDMRGLTVRGNPLRRIRGMNPRTRATMHSRQFMDSPPRLNQHSVDCLHILLHLWVNSYSVSLRLAVGGVVVRLRVFPRWYATLRGWTVYVRAC